LLIKWLLILFIFLTNNELFVWIASKPPDK